jgi:hypothetical protein
VKTALPMTGTSELLDQLSPYIPDEFINQQWPSGSTGGRRHAFSAAQLWRTHLLLLLTPVHSINLLVKLLKEHRGWRRFARLSHRQCVPDVRMLHEFRARMGISTLRKINEQLVKPLLGQVVERWDTIAIIDATDLPAACTVFKKRRLARIRPSERQSVIARLKRARAIGLWVTKNTRCAFGWLAITQRCS